MRGFGILFQSIQEENLVNKIYNIFHQTDNIKYIENTYEKSYGYKLSVFVDKSCAWD